MTFKHRDMATRFTTIMERAGAKTDYRIAATGTIYVTVEGLFKVRFSDHGECYCREDISVDCDGCSLEQAVRAAARRCDLDVARSLASFKAATTRARQQSEEREARLAPVIAAAKAREKARTAFQRDFIAAHYPDYEARSTKSRKRIRARANREFEVQYA
jgi:hypothetical protein